MSPIPYNRETRQTPGPAADFICPQCTALIESTQQTMVCRECGNVPRHGSD